MSLMHMNFFSETLGHCTAAKVILPMGREGAKDLPVLYLLHGMGDDFTSWSRKTAIERYALENGLAVVMPDGELSTYLNMEHGGAYQDFITQELPKVISGYLPVSRDREKTFIAGCSMGGFGALRIGLAYPQNYAAIGCFSAAIMEYRPDSAFVQATLKRVYDEDIDFYDVIMAANARATAAEPYPIKIYHAWGEDDKLRQNAEKTRAFFEGIHSPSLTYEWEMLPGKHDWALWDQLSERFIRQLPLPKVEEVLF